MRDGDSLTVLTPGERTTLADLCQHGDDGHSQLDATAVTALWNKGLITRIGSHFLVTERGLAVNERSN